MLLYFKDWVLLHRMNQHVVSKTQTHWLLAYSSISTRRSVFLQEEWYIALFVNMVLSSHSHVSKVRTKGLLHSYRICNLLFTLTQLEYTTTIGSTDVSDYLRNYYRDV